jgi:hypothetical protein
MKLRRALPSPVWLQGPAARPARARPPTPVTVIAQRPGLAPRWNRPAWLQALALRRSDVLAPAALVLWTASVSTVEISTMNDLGLLAALPATFFAALGLLVVSIVMTLRDVRPSPVRFALHVGCLVVVLHGTVPLILSAPNYPWAYKHIGVTDYVSLHGSVNAATDIYQSWPGFFAGTAWLTKLAGAGSPLAYAAWAPVYFNLLNCLMLAFVFGALRVARPTRWLAVFLFVAGNWIGQDYFAPQALAFVLSLAVFGMLLVVVTHQLSPYMLIIGVALLTVAGTIRPR